MTWHHTSTYAWRYKRCFRSVILAGYNQCLPNRSVRLCPNNGLSYCLVWGCLWCSLALVVARGLVSTNASVLSLDDPMRADVQPSYNASSTGIIRGKNQWSTKNPLGNDSTYDWSLWWDYKGSLTTSNCCLYWMVVGPQAGQLYSGTDPERGRSVSLNPPLIIVVYFILWSSNMMSQLDAWGTMEHCQLSSESCINSCRYDLN